MIVYLNKCKNKKERKENWHVFSVDISYPGNTSPKAQCKAHLLNISGLYGLSFIFQL